MILIPFPEMTALAHDIGGSMGAKVRQLGLHRFPDGESLVTLPDGLDGADVGFVATLRDPDHMALPLRFAAATAREMGACRVGLIAPYLGYMRQDKSFLPGQAVSAPLFADFLCQSFDWLLTVDPHLHRIARLEDIFRVPAMRVATARSIATWISREVPDAILLGPDSESRQWVAEVAGMAGRPFEVLQKSRSGDRLVEVSVPDGVDLRQGTPVILDDIASSGRTMVRVVERVLAAGVRPPVCILIHAVFAGSAYHEIRSAGAARIVSTDSIPHESNAIYLGEMIGQAVSAFLATPPLRDAASGTGNPAPTWTGPKK
ncbi:ribose-phosphate pyrophosphokinase [Labrenzia sp. MBR-25]|jgi:ribose-phosphate pyrophosphokinase|uniref:ribose-phosphate diphosphokinase n=1 Tax=Roseibium TaxID=150830 RepID=UPI00094B68E5|nr:MULTISPECIES: ribose-phosphate diphosphokinase [Roseibium]UES53868.1 ribose-phosphate diphosphokinase [Roseibium aggregatum]UFI06789.1 ribose-phosphate diphosphokinase [Roseibium aggregatum]